MRIGYSIAVRMAVHLRVDGRVRGKQRLRVRHSRLIRQL